MRHLRSLAMSVLFALSLNGGVAADPLYYSVTPVGFGTTDVLLNNEGQYVVPAYGSASSWSTDPARMQGRPRRSRLPALHRSIRPGSTTRGKWSAASRTRQVRTARSFIATAR